MGELEKPNVFPYRGNIKNAGYSRFSKKSHNYQSFLLNMFGKGLNFLAVTILLSIVYWGRFYTVTEPNMSLCQKRACVTEEFYLISMKVKALLLMVLLILSFAFTSTLARAEITAGVSNDSNNSSYSNSANTSNTGNDTIKQMLDNEFLEPL